MDTCTLIIIAFGLTAHFNLIYSNVKNNIVKKIICLSYIVMCFSYFDAGVVLQFFNYDRIMGGALAFSRIFMFLSHYSK